MKILIEKEPTQDTIYQIISITNDYTKDYFTPNVPADTINDLQFQRVMYLKIDDEIISFIVFTCWDGCPNITLMATKRQYSSRGYGKQCIKKFIEHIVSLGFNNIELLTVPPISKPVYLSTVGFYQSMGFNIVKEYTELWESGAIKMRIDLP